MAGKKTYLKLKRGLYRDPAHRERIGPRIWLYLYILDQSNWETGKVEHWRDADAADELGMPQRTIKDQRQGLETAGYISCLITGQKQTITIFNYLNPHTGEIYNVKDSGLEDPAPVIPFDEDCDTPVSHLTPNSDTPVSHLTPNSDTPVSHLTPNSDTPVSHLTNSDTNWDTEGDSPSVPPSMYLNINKSLQELNNAFEFSIGEIQRGISKADYESYLRSLKLKGPVNGSIVLTIPNRLAAEKIEKSYLSSLKSVMSGRLGHPVKLCIEVA